MKSYESSYKKLLDLCRRCEVSIFGLDEAARCLLWTEARDCKLTPGIMRGVSAVMALIREAMGDESGRKET